MDRHEVEDVLKLDDGAVKHKSIVDLDISDKSDEESPAFSATVH